MEKQEIIRELQQKRDIWTKIVSLTSECTSVAMDKATATDYRDSEKERKYHYNSKIKIKDELPIDNAQQVEDEIAYRHRKDCLAAANKKLSLARTVITIATIIGIVITLVPHILNISGGNLDAYANFSGQTNFELREDVDDTDSMQNMIYLVLGIFAAGSQALTVLFAGAAAASSVKSKAYQKVPEINKPMMGLWIAATIVVGIFGVFTWITTGALGALGLLPAFIMSFVFKASMKTLDYSAYPHPTLEESERLAASKAEDAKNQEINDAARKEANAKEEKKFKSEQKKNIENANKEIEEYDQKIEDLTDDIAALMKQVKSENISDKDNNLDTIERLLNYLENGRADTLKEALHLVDLDKEREKDRENQRQIAKMKMENDRFIADLERQEAKRYNDEMLAQQRAHNERMQRELDRHNAQIEREQYEHNREMKQELERLKDKIDS